MSRYRSGQVASLGILRALYPLEKLALVSYKQGAFPPCMWKVPKTKLEFLVGTENKK